MREEEGGWLIEFVGVGKPRNLVFPAKAPSVHTDDLWRTTCFELFVTLSGDAYREINLSPSGAYAAYEFDHYRNGMRPVEIPQPVVALELGSERFSFTARLGAGTLPDGAPVRVGLSAVIEEMSGAKSYWALAHPLGQPDFHHHACFALELTAPSGA